MIRTRDHDTKKSDQFTLQTGIYWIFVLPFHNDNILIVISLFWKVLYTFLTHVKNYLCWSQKISRLLVTMYWWPEVYSCLSPYNRWDGLHHPLRPWTKRWLIDNGWLDSSYIALNDSYCITRLCKILFESLPHSISIILHNVFLHIHSMMNVYVMYIYVMNHNDFGF